MSFLKQFILFIAITASSFYGVHSQEQFVIDELGLGPKFIVTSLEQYSKKELFTKTMAWLEAKEESSNLSVKNKTEMETINFTFITGNAVNLDKQYFNVRYHVTLIFKDGSYTFKPTKIELKLNSKYDMGWKNFSLYSGTMYYKKGKVIRKYKRYVRDLTSGLNELHIELTNHFNKG